MSFDVQRTACAITPDDLGRLLVQGRFDLTDEAATQYGIERLLVSELSPSVVSREHRLSGRDRPDFLIDGRIVIEVKGDRHRQPAVLRQLARYAEHRQVEAIILATSRAMRMPAAIAGKPVCVLNLGRAWL